MRFDRIEVYDRRHFPAQRTEFVRAWIDRPGEPIFLDVPENNTDAMALAARYGMTEVFGCARMVLGSPPRLPDDEIFGVTTFELG